MVSATTVEAGKIGPQLHREVVAEHARAVAALLDHVEPEAVGEHEHDVLVLLEAVGDGARVRAQREAAHAAGGAEGA